MNQTTTPRIAIVIGGDALSLRLLAQAMEGLDRGSFLVVEDRSMSVRRLVGLLRGRRIRLPWLVQQLYSRWIQVRITRDWPGIRGDAAIRSNSELLRLLSAHPKCQRLLCFRAGLIIGRQVMSRLSCFNIHCCSLPEYGGLATVSRALRDGAYEQNATLHRLTERIDGGEVLREVSFRLDPKIPYWRNELIAYEAGVRLARQVLGEWESAS